jgi:preprotein translocase subunit SecE
MSSKSGAMSVLPELFRAGVYKANQGRMVRQFTFFAIAILAAFGCITLARGPLISAGRTAQVALPLVLWLSATWIAFRLVNLAVFADFLISVESELLRVTWPGKQEVIQATVVVVTTMVSLGTFLFLIDLVWTWTFSAIGFSELL